MASKAQIQAHIAQKLVQQDKQKLTGPFVESAVLDNITQGDWNAIAGWLQANNFNAIGTRLGQIVESQVATDADAEAAGILLDDSLSLDEYSRVEGLP
jgi:hypothetical protein